MSRLIVRVRGVFVSRRRADQMHSSLTTHYSLFGTRARTRAGFSLIEILIAMFVFMFGILGVLSMFPVAMSSASRSIGRVRGNIIAQSVLAQLQVDCRVPFVEGTVASSTAGQIQCAMSAPSPISSDDQWNGYFVTITAGSVAKGQSRLILGTTTNRVSYVLGTATTSGATLTDPTPQTWTADEHIGKWVELRSGAEIGEYRVIIDNDASTLTLNSAFDTDPMAGLDYDIIDLALDVCPNWNPRPADGDSFVITRMGLPSLPRGTVDSYASGTLTSVNPGLTWADDEWNGFYVVMLDGDAKGEFHRIADTVGASNTLQLESAFTSITNPPAPGDTFAIVRIAPTSLPRGTIGATASPVFDTDLDCTDDQWNGFLVKMLDGSQEGQVSYIGDTAAANGQLTLRASPSEPSFSSDPSVGDAFEIYNPSVRIGYIREFVDQDAFYAGFADHSDQTVGPLSWSAPWTRTAVSTGNTCTANGSASSIEVTAGDCTLAQPGMLVVVDEAPADAAAGGQVRVITGTVGTNTVNVFPDWTEIPLSGNAYRIQRSLGHFLVITTGRSAGKVIPITDYVQDPTNTNGDQITCAGVRFRELGVTDAKSGTQYNLQNGTGFMIVGGDTFLGSVIPYRGSPSSDFQPATVEFDYDYGYALNTFGLPKTSEPQCGSDIHFEDTSDRETSEYYSVCVFSEGDALNEGPVRVDVFVFRNFNSGVDLWENQKPAAHVTGYIGRP